MKKFGIFLLICLIIGLFNSANNNNNTTSKTEPDPYDFRQHQCEQEHSSSYCKCLIGHVKKNLGWLESNTWTSGGELTNAKGRQALYEATILCQGL